MSRAPEVHRVPFESRVDPNDQDVTVTTHLHIQDGSTQVAGIYYGGTDERGRVIDQIVRHLNNTMGVVLGGQIIGVEGMRDHAARGIPGIKTHAADFGPSSRRAIARQFSNQTPRFAIYNSQGGAVFTEDAELHKGDSGLRHVGIANAVDGISDAEMVDEKRSRARIMIGRFAHSTLVAPTQGGRRYAQRSIHDNMFRRHGVANTGHLTAGFWQRSLNGYRDGAQAIAETDPASSMASFVALGNTAVAGFGSLDTLHGNLAAKIEHLRGGEGDHYAAYPLQFVEVPGQAHLNNAVNPAVLDATAHVVLQQAGLLIAA